MAKKEAVFDKLNADYLRKRQLKLETPPELGAKKKSKKKKKNEGEEGTLEEVQ